MEKEQEQKQFMNNLESEIKELKYQVNNSEKINKKRNFIKNLKINTKIFTATAPYILTAGLITGLFSGANMTPFMQDETNINPYQKKEIDNKGNISYEEQDHSYNSDNELYYYSKWKKEKKGMYSRDVKIFTIDDESIDRIMKLLEDDNLDYNLNLEDFLGSPTSEKKESKNNLTEEEINEKPFIKTIIYDRNEDRLIYHKESVGENIFKTLIWFCSVINTEIITRKLRKKLGFNMHNDIEKIKDNYKPLDTEKLQKKLEIKEENYKILKG